MRKRKLSFSNYESANTSPNAKKSKQLNEKILSPSKIATKIFDINGSYNEYDLLCTNSVWVYVTELLKKYKVMPILEKDCIIGKYKCKWRKFGSQKQYAGMILYY